MVASIYVAVFPAVSDLSDETYVTVVLLCLIPPLCLFYDVSTVSPGVLVLVVGWLFVGAVFLLLNI